MSSPSEIAALVVVASAAIAVLASTTRGRARLSLCATFVLVTVMALRFVPRGPGAPSAANVPRAGTALGYVSSSACRACHPSEHASFGRTYHRTMTQVASTATVKAPLDGRALTLDDRSVRLERRGTEVWATLPDPDAVIEEASSSDPTRGAPDVTRRVVLTTGSHREQAFWVAGKRAGDLRLVPFVWLVEDAAFVARRDAFLTPPGVPLPPVRWASSCIACHAVAGEPRHEFAHDTFDTRVAELGVACEACHGPGAAHVEKHRDPVARYMRAASKVPDPTIVQPRRLPPERSAAVCGQCHAYAFPKDENGWWTDGYAKAFRAGDALAPSRTLIVPETTGVLSAPTIDAPANAIFWEDGAVRVGGREYNGLVASPCHSRGEGDRKMTCLSCHAMHDGDPRGQLAPDHAGDRACTQCHSAGALTSSAHSRHAPGSVGSACVACHMPKTSYALLSQVRSHRIDSPRTTALTRGKPNACNLCHLDRSLAWTASWLSTWYGQPDVGASEVREAGVLPLHLPFGLWAGIAGDAGVRALLADALGSEDAMRAIPSGFEVSILESMRSDPYAAVRFIAERSLRMSFSRGRPRGDGGGVDPEQLRALLAIRDQRAITIAE